MSTVTITLAVSAIKVPERIVLQRVNRFLAKCGEQLRKSRTYRRSQVGAFYVTHKETRAITGCYIDLHHVAQVLGLLQPWEEIE